MGLNALAERLRAPKSDETPAHATIDDSALADYLNVRRARRLSQYVKFTIAAATMAVRDAGLGDDAERIASSSAVLGSMFGSASLCFDYYSQIVAEGVLAANPVLFAEGVPNAAAAHLSSALGVQGSCQTIIGSRTAGLDALALGSLRIRSGAVERVIVVAAEAPSHVVELAYASELMQGPRVVSERRSGGCSALPARGGGLGGACGGVAFVLESARSAQARGVLPYAKVGESAWASCPTDWGKNAAAIASVVSRLNPPGRVLGSACGTWLERAERLGMKRAGVSERAVPYRLPFGELFSISPLSVVAAELAMAAAGDVSAVLCNDWSGAASAVEFERLGRDMGKIRVI
jgi:3-oxoacyl-[acyl-carrier-protein] synthase II